MRKSKYFVMAVLMSGVFCLSACSNDDDVQSSEVSVELNMTGISRQLTVKNGTCRFENIATREVVEVPYNEGTIYQKLTDGLYQVNFIGEGVLNTGPDTEGVEVRLQGKQENVEVKNGKVNLSLKIYAVSSDSGRSGFILSEIAISGTLYPAADGGKPKQYNGDAYFVITNNSDKQLYADGLILAESSFLSTQQREYTPNVMGEAMTVSTVLRIPGGGTEYPVEPGGQLIICDNAMNHKENNPNSVDLSKADFEWYINSSNSSIKDVDNPQVKNMEVILANTKTIWLPSKQGNRAYALAKIPADQLEEYLQRNAYQPTYQMLNPKTQQMMTIPMRNVYKLPNSWILDAVQLSPKNNHEWNVVDPSLDMGYTWLGEMKEVDNHAGKGVIRKILFTAEDGRKVYQDTNNSTEDFLPSVPFSLLKQ